MRNDTIIPFHCAVMPMTVVMSLISKFNIIPV